MGLRDPGFKNRLITTGGVTYTYDGDGRRVKKSNGMLYWAGSSADALVETDLSGNISAEYVFFNGKRVARIDQPANTINYYYSDQLGSADVITNASGTITKESDYYPYGGEIPVISGDSNRYKFSGKERDTESGLDNFGARYDSSNLGRFMTPDWAARPTAVPYAVFGDPQSLNLYGYVRNDPVSRADADGHQAGVEADAIVNRGDTSPFSYGLFGMAFTMWQTMTQSQEIAKMEAFLAEARQRGDSGPPPQAQNAGQLSLTLGVTQVKGSYSFGPTGDTWERPVNGAIIEATPTGCANCSWVQTVSATGGGSHSEHTDWATPGSPIYPQTSKNPSAFHDQPGRQQGDAGASTFTTILGKANAAKHTFHAKGAMTWGYSVDERGKVTGSPPRLATHSELQRALGVVQHDFGFWKID